MSKQAKSKPPKDPNAPVKPPSAFFIYLREEQVKVRRELQRGGNSVSNDIVAKECGRRWQNLDPELKQRYHDQHRAHKMRYEQEMKTYKQSPDVVAAASIANIAKFAKNRNPVTDLPQMFRDYFGFLVSNWQTVALGMPNDSPAEVQQTIWNIWSGSRVVTKNDQTVDTNFNLSQQQPNVLFSLDDSKANISSPVVTPKAKVTPPKLAFHFFVDAIKEQTSYQQEPLSESQLIRLCQERWDGMTEEEMKCFNVMELQDMGRYERELAMANGLLQTPEPASKKRKTPVREAAVKAVNKIVKKEKQDSDYNNDDSMVKQEVMRRRTLDGNFSFYGQGDGGFNFSENDNSNNDHGKLEINENYASSDEY